MSSELLAHASPAARTLEPYQPGKPIEELQRELGLSEVIKLASNENPHGPSPRVLEALEAGLAGAARYPDASGWHLKSKLSGFLDVSPDRLTLGNGSNEVLELVGRIFLRPGAGAVVTEHCFIVYSLVAKAMGAKLTTVPTRKFEQDLDAILDAVDGDTRVIYLANPNNPTGTWVAREPLERFLGEVPADVVVVLDEAYREYVDDPRYPDGVRLLDAYPNLVVTRTFSKAYGLAALRIGYAVSHPSLADLLNRIRQPFNANALAQTAAAAALDDPGHVRRSARANHEGMVRLERSFEELGLEWIPSVANFVTVRFDRDAKPIYDALLRQGVIVRSLGVYGLPNHLRVTVGLPEENERFQAALRSVLGKGR